MTRKPSDSGGSGRIVILVAVALISCSLVYVVLSTALRRPAASSQESAASSRRDVGSRPSDGGEEEGECCQGMEHLELWGSAVKWGTDHRFNSSRDCCRACKAMCRGTDGPCLCDSWVFCGDRERCGEKFGECWLKKQKDSLFPALQEFGDKVIWTSGLIYGKGEGIVGLETDHGTIHIKLLPECAPNSVEYIAQLLESRHCAGCRFYRADSRGNAWDSEGNHIADASLGPPYALIQGTLEAEGVPFREISVEARPVIRRGSVAWVGSGPEFFISLANHNEWRRSYTVFGSVLPEDMEIVEKIAKLPSRSDVWSNVNVSVLKDPVHLRIKRALQHGDLNLGKHADSGSI